MPGGPHMPLEEARKHANLVLEMLTQFKKAIEGLVEIGLTRKAAITQAGKMFDLDINPDDITDTPRRGPKAGTTYKRRKQR